MKRDISLLSVPLLLLAAVSCGKTIDPDSNKNTNWLHACKSDRACGEGLSCLCGVCTTACASAGACEAEHATSCVAVDTEPLRGQCATGSHGDAVAICVAECSDSGDCEAIAAGFECRGGLCLAPSAVPADGGSEPVSADAGPGPVAPDAGTPDAGTLDAGPADAGPVATDCGNLRVDDGERCDGETFEQGACVDCQRVCEHGFADCNVDLADGCEADLLAGAGACGACGEVGDLCAQVLAIDQAGPTSLAINATHLFWTTYGTYDSLGNLRSDGSLQAVPLEGGEIVTLAADLFSPGPVVLDDTHAYWINQSGGALEDGEVWRVELGGGEPEQLATGLFVTSGLAVDDTYLYWVSYTTESSEVSVLFRMPKDGAVEQDDLLTGARQIAGNLLAEDSTLYWMANGEVWSAALDGGNPQQIPGGYEPASGSAITLAMDASSFYFLDNLFSSNASVGSIGRSRGRRLNLATEPTAMLACGIAIDESHVYWGYQTTESDNWTIARTDKSPGATIPVVTDARLARPQIAVTETSLYLVAQGEWGGATGVVLRIAKPQ